MESLFVVLGLIAVAWFLATPILLVSQLKLRSKVDKLVREVRSLDARLGNIARPPEATEAAEATETPGAPDVVSKAEEVQAPVQVISEEVPPPSPAAPVVPPEALPERAALDEAEDGPPKAFVFRQDRFAAVVDWLRDNWVLAAGAASLSLAGIFLVQYGAERGLLTPFWRVMAALGFGLALISGGEYLRRRFGDDTDGATQFLPSALSGAGLLTLFAAVLSARVLYDLIGPGQCFVGLAVVSAIGIVFGWFYGPVLTVVGILGATAAPYLVGGSSDQTWVLQYYFALIAVAALAIDAFKRWAWVSVLGLIATLASIWLIMAVSGAPVHFIAATLIVAAAAVVIPEQRLVPAHDGPPTAAILWRVLPEFPTRLSFGVTVNAAAAALAVAVVGDNLADAYLGLFTMMLLMAATTLWMWRAPALADHTVFPVLAFLGLIAAQALLYGPMYAVFSTADTRPPETAPPAIVWHLLGVSVIGTALIFWRMSRAGMPVLWAVAGASLAPFTVFLLEFLWDPSRIYGLYPWALGVMAVAALMTILSERALRLDLADKTLIVSLFAVAAVSLIGLSLFLVLTKTALTLALATMILLITLLDRRFDLPLLVYYGVVGAAVISYRLIVDPGLDWAMRPSVSLAQVVLAYGGTMLILAGAWVVARSHRPRLSVVLESTLWVLGAALVLVLFERLLPGQGLQSHWGLGLLGALWITMALAQVYRMQGAGRFERIFRKIVTGLFVFAALGTLLFRFLVFNVIYGDEIIGPPFFSTLVPAYLPLAAVLHWRPGNFRGCAALSGSALR